LSDVAKATVSQQQERPGVPGQVKDVERLFQGTCQQHPELFYDMRLRVKRRKTEQQNQRDEKLVVEQIFPECFSLGDVLRSASRIMPLAAGWKERNALISCTISSGW